MDDVRINKAANIERCIRRIREEYADDPKNLHDNITKQDSIILNLERACEAAIDLAMHEVRKHRLGIPQETREAFSMLCKAGLIGKEFAEQMIAMVGFRNIAVHDYQELNLGVVTTVIEKHLDDFLNFTKAILKNT